MLVAGTGDFKTSLGSQLAWQHALHVGPAIYLSFELATDEVLARVISQRSNSRLGAEASWLKVLDGKLSPEDMKLCVQDLEPRLRILDRNARPMTEFAACVEELQARFPGEPILVIVDYLQIVDDSFEQERSRIAAIAERLRQETQRLGIFTLELSQTSRENEKKLRAGKLQGIETVGLGAESGQIERAAAATLALGGKQAIDDSWSSITLSRGKARFETPDCTMRLECNGATGEFRVPTGATWERVVRQKKTAEGEAKRQRKEPSKNDTARQLHIRAALRMAADDGHVSGPRHARKTDSNPTASNRLLKELEDECWLGAPEGNKGRPITEAGRNRLAELEA